MSSILAFLQRVGSHLLTLVGGWDTTLKLLLAMMALDYLSGIIVGCVGRSPNSKTGCIDSRAGLNGLLKKGLILMVIAVAAQIDDTMDGSFVRATTAWFYIVNEAISVIENAAMAGVPMPEKLLKILGRAKEAQERPGAGSAENPAGAEGVPGVPGVGTVEELAKEIVREIAEGAKSEESGAR